MNLGRAQCAPLPDLRLGKDALVVQVEENSSPGVEVAIGIREGKAGRNQRVQGTIKPLAQEVGMHILTLVRSGNNIDG